MLGDQWCVSGNQEITVELAGSGQQSMCTGEEMILFFSTSPVFLFILIIGVFFWREHGTRTNPTFAHECVRFYCGGEVVCAGISIDGRTDVHIIRNGALTGRGYRDEILRPIVISYPAGIRDQINKQQL